MNATQGLTAYVEAFVDELVRAGVGHACLCPGSRSTPLALTLARHPGIKVWTHIDERSAGYFALGLAKTRNTAVALLSTSGTATANFHPAVLEAYYGRVPLVVLTADRPHEHRDTGAPQTVDQIRLYGSQIKWFVEMAPPAAEPHILRYVRTVADRAVAAAQSLPQGPVHLNFPFREPLIPEPAHRHWLPEDDLPPRMRDGDEPYAQVVQGARVLPPEEIERLANSLAAAERGLIICGPQDDPNLATPVTRLAKRLDWPLLADPLSQVRCGPHDRSLVVDAYDAYLRDSRFTATYAPDVVLRIGALPTSKPLMLYLNQHPACRQILVDRGDGWLDPTGRAAQVIHADPALLCNALDQALAADVPTHMPPGGEASVACKPGITSHPWTAAWLRANRLARIAMQDLLASFDEPFEGQVFPELSDLLPNGARLFAGNSMPIRDLDTFFPNSGRQIRFLANRGVNGIDGVVSTALGVAAAGNEPLVLVVGDLSFYHDLNGLLAAKLHRLNATVVLINNDGGGIFSFLPQAESPGVGAAAAGGTGDTARDATGDARAGKPQAPAAEHFENLFGTPTGLDFRPAVEMYGGRFLRVHDRDDFRQAVSKSLANDGFTVVEVRTQRTSNVAMHRQVWQAVSTALKDRLDDPDDTLDPDDTPDSDDAIDPDDTVYPEVTR